MNNNLELSDADASRRRLRLDWLLPLFYRPRPTLQDVVQHTTPVWAAPLLLLSLLALLSTLAAVPARVQDARMHASLPSEMEYFSPEQQAQFQQAVDARQGAIFTFVLPASGALGGVWIGWLLLGGMLHLGLTLAGSRSGSLASLNLAAWASLPIALRYLIRGVYSLTTRRLVTAGGLSGLIASGGSGFGAFAAALLAMVDIYFIWQVILLLVGVIPMSGMAKPKAWAVTLTMVGLGMLLQALPAFALSSLSGLSTSRPFFFF